MNQRNARLFRIAAICWSILLVACNTTRHIPPDEYLLDKVNIQMDDAGADKSLLLSYVQQKPNSSKLSLSIYNWVRNDSGFVKKIIRKIGDPPVIFNNHLVSLSVNELNRQMKNMGYLHATVSAQVDTTNKKAVVNYLVHNGEPYRIRNYSIALPQLQNPQQPSEVNVTARRSRFSSLSRWMQQDRRLIKEGSVFDLDMLEKERARISSQLRNQGYYTFTEENLRYLADTALCSNQVDLTLVVGDTARKALLYTVQQVNVFSGYDALAKDDYKIVDSLEYDGLHLYYDPLHFLRSGVIRDKVLVRPGQLYLERQGKNTYDLFHALKSVRRVDLQYENNYPDSTLLDCNIYLTPGNNHSLQAGLQGTNKAGDFGVALDATYENYNIFNGSEVFTIHVRGAYEFVGRRSSQGDLVNNNYYELAFTPSLTFPKLHLPFIGKYMTDRFNARTQYSLGYNTRRRLEYVRNFFNFNWKMKWGNPKSMVSQSLSLLDINYAFMPWLSSEFIQYLFNDVNGLTRMSYNDIFTAGINYDLVYSNANSGRVRQNVYTFRFRAETSGNALYFISKAAHAKKRDIGDYTLFNNPFAQYVKGSIDFAETVRFHENGSLAFRIGVGVAYPYLNSVVLPFEQRYYGGGPNHVRGWHTRYLGPGSMPNDVTDVSLRVGDINLILGSEYRVKVLSWLEPALFVDAGNIWSIRNYKYQGEEALFSWNRFYKEIAVGTGLGLRFDLSFLILRLDAGTRVYDPALKEGDRFTFLKGRFLKNSALYVAIGYPF